MKNLKLNESSDNSDILIFSLLPNDYNGAPEINDVFPSINPGEKFPMIPSEDEVFSAWSSAGYNSFQLSGYDDDQEYDMFKAYGDFEIYYAVYCIVIDDKSKRNVIFEEIIYTIGDRYFETLSASDIEPKMKPDNFISWIEKIDGITSAFILMRN